MFDPTVLTCADALTLRQRIAARVVEVDALTGCSLTAPVFDYPLIRIRGHLYRLPRIVYALDHGGVPAGRVVDHECHNLDRRCPGGRDHSAGACWHRRCITGAHLVARTQAENMARGRLRDRVT